MDALIKVNITRHTLPFNFPAGTSRGVLLNKKLWLITLTSEGKEGIGECSIIEGLSPEFTTDASYEKSLKEIVLKIQNSQMRIVDLFRNIDDLLPELVFMPSIRFGLETAFRSWLVNGSSILFDNAFTRGERNIPINGLIWMGTPEQMSQEIEQKIKQGFRVLKFKIAALPWEQEKALLHSVRKRFPASQLEIRVDANGGLSMESWASVFSDLESLEVHSIEQPLPPDQRYGLKLIASKNSIPVALDESLIGCFKYEEKKDLLTEIMPPYIILKPSLMGGIKGVSEWISLAESLGIGWWITSALESNIGLNAIAQFTSEYAIKIPQGLGTGGLFKQNFPCPLRMENGFLTFQREAHSKISSQLV